MNRRNFINKNLVAAPILHAFTSTEEPKEEIVNAKIKFYCPRWGANDSWDSFCKRVKEAGYDGIEAAVSSPDVPEKDDMQAALKKYNLELIGQYWQSLEANVEENARNFERYLHALASLRPVFINSQTGKDFFSIEQNKKIIAVASKFTKDTGIEVVHETHRGKALFAAHISKNYFDQLNDLRITLDISHWCNVHESLLQDQQDIVDVALNRTRHIHSRVGFQEGPQVNDPRAGEWKDTVDAHLKWWDKVVSLHANDNRTLTITTEFGPAGYMPVLPYTRQPVADQWEINVHMMRLLKSRYKIA